MKKQITKKDSILVKDESLAKSQNKWGQLNNKIQQSLAASLENTYGYNPFQGMDADATPQERQVELTKIAQPCATYVVDGLVDGVQTAVRLNELLEFVDSFGTNHSLDTACCTVEVAY